MEHISDFIYDNFYAVMYVLAFGILFTLYTSQNTVEYHVLNNVSVDKYLVSENSIVNVDSENIVDGDKVLAQVLSSNGVNETYVNGVAWTFKNSYSSLELNRIDVDAEYKKEEYALSSGNTRIYYTMN